MVRFRDLLPARRAETGLASSEEAPFAALQRDLARVVDDFFSGADLPAFAERGIFGAVAPRVDVEETDKEIKVTAELPGLSENDVEVTLGDDTLTIRGEKKQEEERKEANYYRKERTFGQFQRTIALPASVDESKVDAVFKNGVLHVTLPKTEEAQARKKIEVKAGE